MKILFLGHIVFSYEYRGMLDLARYKTAQLSPTPTTSVCLYECLYNTHRAIYCPSFQ